MIPVNITMCGKHNFTFISNEFIDNYMNDANDAQIKVYLYLLRVYSEQLPTNIAEISDKFNYTEKEVIRSLKYWEKKQLIQLKYNENNDITGININDFVSNATNEIPTNRIKSCDTRNSVETASIIPMTMDFEKEKNSYDAAGLSALKKDKNVTTLLNISAQYFGHPLNANEIRTLIFIYDRLGFSLELADYLVEYCVSNNMKDIKTIEQIAIGWYKDGVSDIGSAKKHLKKSDKTAQTIMGYLGKTGNITDFELKFINRWTGYLGFSLSIIEEACKRTVLHTDVNRFNYANGILEQWHKSNVKNIADIEQLEQAYESSRKTTVKARKDSGNALNGFEKRDYDIDEIEKKLLSN